MWEHLVITCQDMFSWRKVAVACLMDPPKERLVPACGALRFRIS